MQIHFLTSFLLILIVNQGRAQVVIEPSYSAFRYVGPQWARFLFYNPVTVLYTARTYSTTVTTFFTICTYSTTTSLPACALKRQLLTENEPKIAIAPTTIESGPPTVVPVLEASFPEQQFHRRWARMTDHVPLMDGSGRFWALPVSTTTISSVVTSSSVSTSSLLVTCSTLVTYDACPSTPSIITATATTTSTVTVTVTSSGLITFDTRKPPFFT